MGCSWGAVGVGVIIVTRAGVTAGRVDISKTSFLPLDSFTAPKT